MKRDASWVTAIAVVAATTFGLSSLQSKSGAGALSTVRAPLLAPSKGAKARELYDKDACGDLEKRLQLFFALPASANVVPPSCYANKHPLAPSPDLLEAAQSVQFIIATLPDPVHTHLSLIFDRDAEAIQQAAQDADFTYDSSWLPWETQKNEYQLLADQDAADDRTERLEDQPGILLFRRTLVSTSHGLPYTRGLIVFIVGEEATGGIHRRQFVHAVQWIKALQPNGSLTNAGVKILGPTFSGSLPSLMETLQEPDVLKTLANASPNALDIYSGQSTSQNFVPWLDNSINHPPLDKLHIQFRGFQPDQDTTLRDYCSYMVQAGLDTSRLAIISEDETEYGYAPARGTLTSGSIGGQPCVAANLTLSWRFPYAATFYYPRDISAVRTAYQEQSLFSRFTAQSSSETGRRTLATDLADPEGKQSDTIHSYGTNQTALSEEADLLQIVDMLRAHQSQTILLKSTNPLDQLFLAQFFKLTYPEGRIYILGDDLLFRREAGSRGLDGIMTLSTYPSLPEIEDWTKPNPIPAKNPRPPPLPAAPGTLDPPDPPRPLEADFSHSHHIFTQSSTEGTYVALRFLLQQSMVSSPTPETPSHHFLPPNCGFRLNGFYVPNYSAPFWLTAYQQACHTPVVWVSVLGSDRLWPVASLEGEIVPPSYSLVTLLHPLQSIAGLLLRRQSLYSLNSYRLPDVPLSMNVCLFAVLAWALFHLNCCIHPSITVKPDHRTYFVRQHHKVRWHFLKKRSIWLPRKHPRSRMILLMIGSVLLITVCTTLAWGCGWMSPEGEPIRRPLFYSLLPPAIWLIVASAVGLNAWIESRLAMHKRISISLKAMLNIASLWTKKARRPTNWTKQDRKKLEATKIPLKAVLTPLFIYILATFTWYAFILLFLDDSLYPQNRILTYFRSMNLTNGVSPIVPLALLALGMYGWTWYALKGLSLLGGDRPLLPFETDLILEIKGVKQQFFTMIGAEHAARPIESYSQPFHKKTWGIAGGIFAAICLSAPVLANGSPLRSLGTERYSYFICIWVAISISIVLANVWQLMQLWLRLRALLVFIDKLPLRRTMHAMRGFTWGSIWKMGGNVLELRYKLSYRQFESLSHLEATLKALPPANIPEQKEAVKDWIDNIRATRACIRAFGSWYSQHWHVWQARDLSTLQRVQQRLARIGGKVLTTILVPAWNAEQESLLLVTPQPTDTSDAEGAHMQELVSQLPPHIRNAEETVCLLYLGFIQNILGRMRSLVIGMIWLFLSIAMVVPSYPFDPRPLLTGAVAGLFIVVGLVVFIVYSQMFRDATLSHLTNTRPGELGMEFWLKFISFGVGPLFGLLATVFPEFSSFFFSWLQPSLSSIK